MKKKTKRMNMVQKGTNPVMVTALRMTTRRKASTMIPSKSRGYPSVRSYSLNSLCLAVMKGWHRPLP